MATIEFPCVVWRIQLRWDGARWNVERRTRIESMTLPRSLEDDDPPAGGGTAYDVRDLDGGLIYRQHVPGAVPETFLADGTILRAELPENPAIDVLVPDVGADGALRVVSSELPGPADADEGGVAVLVELPLGELIGPQDEHGG